MHRKTSHRTAAGSPEKIFAPLSIDQNEAGDVGEII
jgi:hypothetical protein